METKNWQNFRLNNLFDIYTSKDSNLLESGEGKIPYVSSTRENNGVSSFVDTEPTHAAGTLTIARNGSVGATFYHSYPYCASPDDVRILKPKFIINNYIGLFISNLIEKESYRYAYGRKFGTKRMKITEIRLPVTNSGEPDWKWIENYMKNEVINKLPGTVQDLFSEDYKPKSIIQKKLSLETEKWKWFRYDEIFDIQIGRSIDLNKLEQGNGTINYVARTEENNGITARVVDDGTFEIYEGNCLTVPMVGNELKASYQTEKFCVSQNISIFRQKTNNLNKYNAIFLNTLIRKDMFRFAYGRTLSLERLKMLKIKLPVTPSGTPDWQFMEDYIKSLPYSASL